MLAKLQEQLQALLQALGLVPQPQPIRISEAEQQRLRREARQRR
ncbi:PA1414 family protein [Ectopseudomonas guguanensis]|nr:PA1414 family protein [Pseudomonas guguanensis]